MLHQKEMCRKHVLKVLKMCQTKRFCLNNVETNKLILMAGAAKVVFLHSLNNNYWL